MERDTLIGDSKTEHEYKATVQDAVALIASQNYSVSEAAMAAAIRKNMLYRWK
jgi:hypothetical protein